MTTAIHDANRGIVTSELRNNVIVGATGFVVFGSAALAGLAHQLLRRDAYYRECEYLYGQPG